MARPTLKLYLSLIEAHALIYGLTQSNHVMTGPSYFFFQFSLKESLKNINHACINANYNEPN